MRIMNTPTNTKRANLTLPADVHDFLKNQTPNMSEYVAEAVRERHAREKREKALQEILAAAPSFTNVKEGSDYVDMLRNEDRERDKRHSLV
jgi:hypothetical protein